MSEELSKRIDDIHKRFDDLRGDISARLTDTNKRIDDLRMELSARIADTIITPASPTPTGGSMISEAT